MLLQVSEKRRGLAAGNIRRIHANDAVGTPEPDFSRDRGDARHEETRLRDGRRHPAAATATARQGWLRGEHECVDVSSLKVNTRRKGKNGNVEDGVERRTNVGDALDAICDVLKKAEFYLVVADMDGAISAGNPEVVAAHRSDAPRLEREGDHERLVRAPAGAGAVSHGLFTHRGAFCKANERENISFLPSLFLFVFFGLT